MKRKKKVYVEYEYKEFPMGLLTINIVLSIVTTSLIHYNELIEGVNFYEFFGAAVLAIVYAFIITTIIMLIFGKKHYVKI